MIRMDPSAKLGPENAERHDGARRGPEQVPGDHLKPGWAGRRTEPRGPAPPIAETNPRAPPAMDPCRCGDRAPRRAPGLHSTAWDRRMGIPPE